MALAKVFPSLPLDIVLGMAVVSVGDGVAKQYDAGAARTVHISQPSGTFFENLDTRYRYHGGVGGSGNWEH